MNPPTETARRYLLLALSAVLLSGSLSLAQQPENRSTPQINHILFDLGGNGLFMSVNYGRVVNQYDGYLITGIAGIGMFPPLGGTGAIWTAPHQLTLNLGRSIQFMEIGIGGTYATGKTNASGYTEASYSYNLSPILGYRLQFKNKMVFRAYLSPIVHLWGEFLLEDYRVLPYLGLSLGYQL